MYSMGFYRFNILLLRLVGNKGIHYIEVLQGHYIEVLQGLSIRESVLRTSKHMPMATQFLAQTR